MVFVAKNSYSQKQTNYAIMAQDFFTENKMKKKTGRIIGITAAILIIAGVLGTYAVGNYLVTYSIARKTGMNTSVAPKSSTGEQEAKIIADRRQEFKVRTQNWYDTTPHKVVTVKSAEGLTLEADVFEAKYPSSKWVIAVHGYTNNRTSMYNIASFYSERGFNVITPDNRAHGKSDGKYIGMGWLDRKDMLRWINYILEQDQAAKIVLHGISMGAATVMMVSGETLPSNIRCIVEDCGYTSVWDIFRDELKYLFHLPPFPFLTSADGIALKRAGYTFKQASSVKQLQKTSIPMLFIHGSRDTFVHPEMMDKVYDACASSVKQKLLIEGAGHGESYLLNPDLYFSTVFDFVNQNL